MALQKRSRAIAYGEWQPYKLADPIRDHVQRLRLSGLGVDRIATLAGVGSGTLRQLLYGSRRTGKPLRRVRAATAERLLAVEPIKKDGQAGGSSSVVQQARE